MSQEDQLILQKLSSIDNKIDKLDEELGKVQQVTSQYSARVVIVEKATSKAWSEIDKLRDQSMKANLLTARIETSLLKYDGINEELQTMKNSLVKYEAERKATEGVFKRVNGVVATFAALASIAAFYLGMK